ncbi:ribbon-helix-helix domain-containing protein [Erwinia sp. 198]|nr:ribbon-helix-helix domain-containing protein [Erwinia sp. 198]RRZ88545.1 ribbon-helix-helix domain-containing protein [Erwinia sp. 198]
MPALVTCSPLSDKLAQQSRIPESRLLNEAIAGLLKKHGFSDGEINEKQ